MSGTSEADVRLEPVTDTAWLDDYICRHWGAPGAISRGRLHSAETLAAIRAVDAEGVAGVVSWAAGRQEWEVVTLNSRQPGRGIGTRLLDAVVEIARRAGAKKLWLTTTNDNLDALRFYQKRGWRLSAVRPGVIAGYRKLKPSIPVLGAYGIPLSDEIELEYGL